MVYIDWKYFVYLITVLKLDWHLHFAHEMDPAGVEYVMSSLHAVLP